MKRKGVLINSTQTDEYVGEYKYINDTGLKICSRDSIVKGSDVAVRYHGKLYLLEGRYNYNDDRFCQFDMETNELTYIYTMSGYAAGMIIYNDILYIFARHVDFNSGKVNNRIYKYDEENNTLISLTYPDSAEQGVTKTEIQQKTVYIYNGKLHLVGGNPTISSKHHFVFDGETWESIDDLPIPLVRTNIVAIDNEIHLFGSTYTTSTSTPYEYPYLYSHYKYNSEFGWTKLADVSADMTGNDYSLLHDGMIYSRDLTYVYNEKKDEIITINTPDSRYVGSGLIDDDGKFYWFGVNSSTYSSNKSYYYSVHKLPIFHNEIALFKNEKIYLDGVKDGKITPTKNCHIEKDAIIADLDFSTIGFNSFKNIDEYTIKTVNDKILQLKPLSECSFSDMQVMIEAHYAGLINIRNYWNLGDRITVDLSPIEQISGVYSTYGSQPAQRVQFEIVGFEHDELETKRGNFEKAAVTFYMVDSLSEVCTNIMNSYTHSSPGYFDYSYNKIDEYITVNCFNSLPQELKDIIINVKKWYQRATYGSSSPTEMSKISKLFLLSAKEAYGNYTTPSKSYSSTDSYYYYNKSESNENQYDYYIQNPYLPKYTNFLRTALIYVSVGAKPSSGSRKYSYYPSETFKGTNDAPGIISSFTKSFDGYMSFGFCL